MNYQKIYDDICKRGQERILPKEVYTEKHHIIPKCLGGGNEKENITKLTAREHFICHLILARKLYPNHRGLWLSLKYMTGEKKGLCVSGSRTFEEIKIEVRRLNSGPNSCRFGVKHTDEVRAILRQTNSGRTLSDEHKKAISDANTGRKPSQETIKKISDGNKGKIISKEQRDKQSEFMTGRFVGENNPNFGKPRDIEVRRQISQTIKENGSSRGSNNGMFGRKHSDESKRMMSENRSPLNLSKEHYEMLSQLLKGKQRSASFIDFMLNNHPRAIKLIHIESGMIFNSRLQAGKYFNIGDYQIQKQISEGIFKIVNKNEEDCNNS